MLKDLLKNYIKKNNDIDNLEIIYDNESSVKSILTKYLSNNHIPFLDMQNITKIGLQKII